MLILTVPPTVHSHVTIPPGKVIYVDVVVYSTTPCKLNVCQGSITISEGNRTVEDLLANILLNVLPQQDVFSAYWYAC